MALGTDGNDYLVGTDGDDTLHGGAGDDILVGGQGNDTMSGGTGNDTFYVDAAGDIVIEVPAEGYDRVAASISYILAAGSEIELLEAINLGSTDPINLTGNDFSNTVAGNAGSNILDGGAGGDVLWGYGGNDYLIGGTGGDVLYGGTGNDTYHVDSASDVAVEALGEGTDRLSASVNYALSLDSEMELIETANLGSTVSLNLSGSNFANTIYGNNGVNILSGMNGNDVLHGFGGDDFLIGGAGADSMYGGAGNDTYYIDSDEDRIYELSGEGYDRVAPSVSYTLPDNAEVELIEAVSLGATDSLNFGGSNFANTILGNNGVNILRGHSGNDALHGFAGDDALDGGLGDDVMYGGGGNDTYYVDSIGDRIYELAGEGFDRVAALVSVTLPDNAEIELIEAVNLFSAERMDLGGSNYANIISGNAGINILRGHGGGDTLYGYGGDDHLDGGTGNDSMYGGAGNDTYYVDSSSDHVNEVAGEGIDRIATTVSLELNGGSEVEILDIMNSGGTEAINLTGSDTANILIGNAGVNLLNGRGGNDTLTGGAGVDTFAFTATLGPGNVDTITDFDPVFETIMLGGVFTGLATGRLAENFFTTGAAATSAAHRIIYNLQTGALFFDADGNGAGAALQFATLAPNLHALSGADFQVLGTSNTNPVLTSGTAASVAENSPAALVVYTATATDADGDSIVFSLGGQHADRFNIDPVTGEVRLNNHADFETLNSYSFVVSAMDSSGQGGSQAVTLTVTDVDENGDPYVVTDIESNDSIGTAQVLDRGRFTPVSDSNVPDGTLPTARIQGSISPNTDADFFTITLQAGELLILDVDGTNSLDALLRVFGPNGVEVAENDDQGSFDPGSTAHSGISHNLDSLIKFRAPTSGTYTFSIQSFADASGPTSSGSYTINVSIGPPATQAQIHEENIQALLSGSTWSTTNLTYGFTTSVDQYALGDATDERATFQPLNSTQESAVRRILPQISNFTNLVFTEASSPGSAQLRYARSDDPDTAHAYYPGSGDGGDSWYNISGGRYDNPVVGNYAWLTFVHETGHALGLKHGHESPALSPDRDSMEFSVMTYRGYIGAPGEGGYTNETFGFAQTFMMYDIAALQRMYGADFTYNNGDSVYSWNASSGAFLVNGVTQWAPGGNRVFMTIWDGDGNDTFNVSNYGNNVTIDLRPGEWTITSQLQLANLGEGHSARGNVANSLLYNNDPRSLIENAIAGSGNDTLIANQAANRLTGGAAADTFRFASNGDVGTGALADTITDFLSGTDRIDLSGLDSDANSSGDQAFNFVGTGAFTGVAGQLRYAASNGNITIFGDVNGDGVADFSLLVQNSTTLTSNDFIL